MNIKTISPMSLKLKINKIQIHVDINEDT